MLYVGINDAEEDESCESSRGKAFSKPSLALAEMLAGTAVISVALGCVWSMTTVVPGYSCVLVLDTNILLSSFKLAIGALIVESL